MSKNTKNRISSIRYYNCGNCVNQLAFAYRNRKPEKRTFPAGVFLLHHRTEGYILFDTGYAPSIYKTGFLGLLYRTLNPTYIHPRDEIAQQLKKDGIHPQDIRYIILSHLHPDHIGGVKFFPDSKIIITEGSYQTYKNPRWNDLLFRSLLPNWFEQTLRVLNTVQLQQHTRNGLYCYDLFGDNSLLLVELEGHTHGHLGAYIPDSLLLAGDACWGEDLMEDSRQLRLLARFTHHNHRAFQNCLNQLSALRDNGVRLCFSHDRYTDKELLK